MDMSCKQNQEELELYLQLGDTKKFITSWPNVVGGAVLAAGEIFDLKERKYKRPWRS